MRKAWVVSSGFYSDYDIHCVCLIEELAHTVCDKMNKQHPRADTFGVEEIPLVEIAEDVFSEDLYTVKVDWEGEESGRWQSYRISWDKEESDPWDNLEPSVWNDHHVVGSSKRGYDVALKIARDKLYEFKAKSME